MPQAVAGALLAAGVQAATVALILSTLVQLGAQLLITRLLQKKPARGSFPINVTLRSPITERRVLFGSVRAAGSFVFYGTSGTNNKFLWYVVAFASHQCSAMRDCWIDKYKIPAADINGTTGAVATAVFDGKLKIWDHLGTQAQSVDTNLDSAFTEWTSTHRLRGICYHVMRLERSTAAWPTGAPQSVNRLIDGALLYDPRLDTTNGGSGSHRRDDPQTWAFSRNWALAVRWYLSGGSVVNDQASRLIMFGLKESDSRIDDAYTIAAANIADQSLSGANAPPSGAEMRYMIDIEISCGQIRRDVLEELLMCGGPGQLVPVHGKWRIYAGAYDAPVHTFTQDDLFGEIECDDTSGDEDRFNLINAVHIDAAKDYTEATSPSRTNSAYVTQDAGQTIQREVVIRGCTRATQAQRITERILRDSRQMRTVKIPFGRQGLKIAPWETFSFSHQRFGWSSRVFRCMERDPQRNESGGMICMITAKAAAASVDTDLLTADYSTGTSVTNSLQSEPPDEPTSLTAISHPGSILFTWVLGQFWQENGIVELYEHTASTPFSSATKVWEGRANSAIVPHRDTIERYYWVRMRTIGGQVSATEPPTTGLAAEAAPFTEVFSQTNAGPITKTLTAPSGNSTVQVEYAEFTHEPHTRVDLTVTFRVGVATSAAPGAWRADLVAFWGTTGGSVNFIAQPIQKSDLPFQVITLVGTFPSGSVVGTATRRFGVAVDIFGDGVNNVDVIVRDITVVATVYHP